MPRGEIRATLGSAHGEGGKGVLEGLFKCQELENGKIDRRMEPDAPLVGAYGVVVLHAVAHVGAYAAGIVHPRHAECVDSVGGYISVPAG